MLNRLFQIVYLLMEKTQMTAGELAEILEVSERTIYRDIDKLTVAGIPIYTNQGKGGGISILPNYVLDKTVLTTEEKNKIMESLNALEAVSLDDDDSMSKLRSFLGKQYQDWIEIEFSSWGNSREDAVKFEQIKNAILERYYMKIIYSGNQESMVERKIKPIKLCFKQQAWYLYAYCCLREDYRFFKLRRISQMEIMDVHFETETVGKVLSKGNDWYSDNQNSLIVTLEIGREMAYRAYEELNDLEVSDKGSLICDVEVSDMDWFISYVLSYGSHIHVVKPEAVKNKVISEIDKMRRIYFE